MNVYCCKYLPRLWSQLFLSLFVNLHIHNECDKAWELSRISTQYEWISKSDAAPQWLMLLRFFCCLCVHVSVRTSGFLDKLMLTTTSFVQMTDAWSVLLRERNICCKIVKQQCPVNKVWAAVKLSKQWWHEQNHHHIHHYFHQLYLHICLP